MNQNFLTLILKKDYEFLEFHVRLVLMSEHYVYILVCYWVLEATCKSSEGQEVVI